MIAGVVIMLDAEEAAGLLAAIPPIPLGRKAHFLKATIWFPRRGIRGYVDAGRG